MTLNHAKGPFMLSESELVFQTYKPKARDWAYLNEQLVIQKAHFSVDIQCYANS